MIARQSHEVALRRTFAPKYKITDFVISTASAMKCVN